MNQDLPQILLTLIRQNITTTQCLKELSSSAPDHAKIMSLLNKMSDINDEALATLEKMIA